MRSNFAFCLQMSELEASQLEALQEQAAPVPARQALRGLANSDAEPSPSGVTSRSDCLPTEGDAEVIAAVLKTVL